MREFRVINALDQIDFEHLFTGSRPYMDANYRWPDGAASEEDKRAHLLRVIDYGLSDREIVGDGRLFAHACFLDGVNVTFGLGVLRGSELTIYTAFVAPDANGSRAFLYDAVHNAEYEAFLAEHGITSRRFEVVPGGSGDVLLREKRGFTKVEPGHNGLEVIVTGEPGA